MSQIYILRKSDVRKLLPLCIVFTIFLFVGCKYDSYSLEDSPDTGLARVVIETDEALRTKTEYIDASAGFYKYGSKTNGFDKDNKEELLSGFDFRLRGNTTNTGTKRPYNLKFPKKREAVNFFSNRTYTNYVDNSTNGEIKRVTLLANALEASMMRNDISFAMMGNNLGAGAPPLNFQWTVNHEFVDLYLNNDYKGTYLMTDATKNITKFLEFNKKVGESGFFLSIDDHYDEDPKFRTEEYNLPVMPKWPEADDYKGADDKDVKLSDTEYATEVLRFKSALEEKEGILNSGSWDAIKEAFDIDSFAKFWLLVNIVGTSDPELPFSVYFYQLNKNGDTKLYCGPGWDFDMWTFLEPYHDLFLTDDWYYETFMEHDEFIDILQNYWFQLRNFGTIKYRYEADGYKANTGDYTDSTGRDFVVDVATYIDNKAKKIRRSWNANGKIYDNRISALGGQFQTIEGHAYSLKEYLDDRAETLDSLIYNL